MFHLNVMVDAEMRANILKLVKNGLREAVPVAIAEKFAEDGWLDKRFDAALSRLDLPKKVKEFMSSKEWWAQNVVREAIGDVMAAHTTTIRHTLQATAEKQMDMAMKRFQDRIDALVEETCKRLEKTISVQEAFIQRVVAEELRRRLT